MERKKNGKVDALLDVWRESNFVLTGSTGFLGSSVLRTLLQETEGFIAVLVRSPEKLPKDLRANSRVLLFRGDMTKFDDWERFLRSTNISFRTWFQLAWSGVGSTERNSLTQMDNTTSTIKSFLCAVRLGIPTWIGSGSQAEYGFSKTPRKENQPCHPDSLYGVAKLAVAHSLKVLSQNSATHPFWARFFSIYGPGMPDGWLIPDTIRNCLRRKTSSFTAGKQLWDFLHVSDATNALLTLSRERPTDHIVYNIAYGRSLPVRDIVLKIRDAIGTDIQVRFGDLSNRRTGNLEADISRVCTHTTWRPSIDPDSGILNTIRGEVGHSVEPE